MRRHSVMPCVLPVALLMAGCAGEQMYAGGQAWQRNQCQQMPDDAQRARCLERADTRYEDYRRGTQAPGG